MSFAALTTAESDAWLHRIKDIFWVVLLSVFVLKRFDLESVFIHPDLLHTTAYSPNFHLEIFPKPWPPILTLRAWELAARLSSMTIF